VNNPPSMDLSSLQRFLGRNAVDVAPELLGWTFYTTIGDARTAVTLTEVEAYMGADDPASHAYRGLTPRTAPMFEAGGLIYVYFVYGMHFCANIVTGIEGEAQAVLMRGGIPIAGVEVMANRRGRTTNLANGPGNLAQALGLTTANSGWPIDGSLIGLEPGQPPERIATTRRIGISKATDRSWRFVADA